MLRIAILLPWFAFLCAFFAGCNQVEETLPEVALAVEAAVTQPEANDKPVEAPETPELAEGVSAPAEVAEFTPPFPDRQEMFEAPARQQASVRREDEAGQSVELKGFINVGQPLAVLSIDGVIAGIPAGGERYGVQVRTIEPPKVVLERGRDRWTATLD